jgi:hypothetical protein
LHIFDKDKLMHTAKIIKEWLQYYY